MRRHSVLPLLVILVGINSNNARAFSPITITTKTTLKDQTPEDVQAFLASPGNWPKIVATSMGVASDQDVSKSLPVGTTVDEIFGLPPILPLSVQWTCIKDLRPVKQPNKMRVLPRVQQKAQQPRQSSSGRLEYFSPKGLQGVAKNCEMIFVVSSQEEQDSTSGTNVGKKTNVMLNMKYQPESFLAVVALPILTIDNFVALNFLLPAAMKKQPELDKFRTLMGTLYGIAGVAHVGDCILGSSHLLTMAGAPSFLMLPFWGKLYALLWCLVGPISFGLSRVGAGLADIGLLLYGIVEVGGAALISIYCLSPTNVGDAATIDPLMNAVLLQVIVGASWYYSAKKPQSTI